MKEITMKLTYEAIIRDPELLARTLAEARRERAEAVHRFIKRIFG